MLASLGVSISTPVYNITTEVFASEAVYSCPTNRRRGVDTRSAFDMYDLSKTGFISRRDFREAMRKLQVEALTREGNLFKRTHCSLAGTSFCCPRPLLVD